MTKTVTVLGSAGLLAAAALVPAGLTFAPEEGTELGKVFATRLELQADDLVVQVNGQEIPFDTVYDGLSLDELTVEASYELELEDTYEEVGEGRPLSLLRRFVRIAGEYETGAGESDSGEDDETFSVRFLWSEDDEAYECSYVEVEEGEEEEELLEILDEDMDLRALLPDHEVEEGDEWRVPLTELGSLVVPGFAVDRASELMEEEDDADLQAAVDLVRSIQAEAASTLEAGELTCTFEESSIAEDTEIAVIALACDLVFDLDLRDFYESIVEQDENIPDDAEVDSLDLSIELDLRGELRWGLEAGHFHSLELTGELSGELDAAAGIEIDGIAIEFGGTLEFSGTLARTVRLEE